jgi:hypothetical protein
MNRDLQARGFESLVEHHDIERVTSSEDRIHISCVVSVLEDDSIEVPPPSVQRSICQTIIAQAPVEVVFHIGAEWQVIRAIRADVAKVSCVVEAMLYGPGVESSSETVTIIDTHPDCFSVLTNMLVKDHYRRRLIYGTLLPMPGLICSRSPTCTKSKGWSCTMRQRCATWQARKLWLHFYDGQFRLTAHNCRTSACLS